MFWFFGDQTPRDIEEKSSSAKKRNLTEKKVAAEFTLLDETGPDVVTAWGRVAESLCQLVRAIDEGSARGDAVARIIELDRVRIYELPKSSWSGTVLTRIRCLHSIAAVGTRLVQLSERWSMARRRLSP